MQLTKALLFTFLILSGLLTACQPSVSTREPSLVQMGLSTDMNAAQGAYRTVQFQIDEGQALLETMEDTSRENFRLILLYDTLFAERFHETKGKWVQATAEAQSHSRKLIQEIQDRYARLRAQGWEESEAECGLAEAREDYLNAEANKASIPAGLATNALRALRQEMDTLPVPQAPRVVLPIQPPPYVPPVESPPEYAAPPTIVNPGEDEGPG